jgi:hypothetical protein
VLRLSKTRLTREHPIVALQRRWREGLRRTMELEEEAGEGRWRRALEERAGGGRSKRELEELVRARIREMQQERTVYPYTVLCSCVSKIIAGNR